MVQEMPIDRFVVFLELSPYFIVNSFGLVSSITRSNNSPRSVVLFSEVREQDLVDL